MVVNTANGHHLHIDQWEHPLPTSPAWYRYQNLQWFVDDIIMQTSWWWLWSKCFSPLACDCWYHCTFGFRLGLMMMMRKGPLRVISTENGLYGVIFSTICQSSKSEFKAAATSLNVPSSTIKTADQQSLQIGCKRNNIWQLAFALFGAILINGNYVLEVMMPVFVCNSETLSIVWKLYKETSPSEKAAKRICKYARWLVSAVAIIRLSL